jgi:hypothetical protein
LRTVGDVSKLLSESTNTKSHTTMNATKITSAELRKTQMMGMPIPRNITIVSADHIKAPQLNAEQRANLQIKLARK